MGVLGGGGGGGVMEADIPIVLVLLQSKDVLVEIVLQLFIGKVNVKLLEAIDLQETDGRTCFQDTDSIIVYSAEHHSDSNINLIQFHARRHR